MRSYVSGRIGVLVVLAALLAPVVSPATPIIRVGAVYGGAAAKGLYIKSFKDYAAAVEEAAAEMGVDLGVAENKYRYLYGGLSVAFSVKDIRGFLAGYRPDEVAVAAHYWGAWHVLPARIYRRVIETPHAVHYIYPEKISPEDIVEIRLPPEIPDPASPTSSPCTGIRGALGWMRLGLSIGSLKEIPIYIFIRPEHRGRAVYAYTVSSRKGIDPWTSSMPLPGLALVAEAGLIHGPGEAAKNLLGQPLWLGGGNVSVDHACPPGDPTCSIPDGGEGGHEADYYEIWPSITRLVEPVIRLGPGSPERDVYVKPVINDGLWHLIDIFLEGVALRITAYMENGAPVPLRIYIDDDYAGEATVYPGEYTSAYIEYWFPRAPRSGKELAQPIHIKLMEDGAGSDISVHAELIPLYLLGSYSSMETVMEHVAASTYIVELPEAGNGPGSHFIVLHRDAGYRYSFEALYPAPKTGLPLPRYMLGGEAYITELELVQRSVTRNSYKVTICVANMFCQETGLAPGASSAITIVWDERLIGAIRDLWAAQGYVPIVFSIEPSSISSGEDTDLLVLEIHASTGSRLELTTIPLYHNEFIEGGVNVTEWTGLVDKTVLSEYMAYVWYAEAYVPVYRVVNNRYASINTYIASPLRVAAAANTLPKSAAASINLKVEAKPFAAILMYDESSAGKDNYYTMNELAEYEVMEVAVHVDGIQYTGLTTVDVLDYAPGWGAVIPNTDELASQLISVVGMAIDVSMYVSASIAAKIAKELPRLVTAASLFINAYGVLKAMATNYVEVHMEPSLIRCVWRKAPLAEPARDKGIVLRVNDAYASYSEPGIAEGYVEIHVASPNAGIDPGRTWRYTVRMSVLEAPR